MVDSTPPTTSQVSQNATHSTLANSQSSFTAPQLTLPPSTLDVLPLMTSLLLRLQSSNPGVSLLSGTTPQMTSTPSASTLANSSIDKSPFSTAPLTAKEIPLAADEIKQRIRKARTEILRLDDMDRTIVEQEEEMRELEAKIAEQRKAVEDLKAIGKKALDARGDVVPTTVEPDDSIMDTS